MKHEPSGLETLVLWRLAVAGGGDWKGDVKPVLKGPAWGRLASAGLVEEEKRSPPAGGRKRLFVSLTDEGWHWLAEHLGGPIATRSPASLEILVGFLSRLGAHLGRTGLALAEFIQCPSQKEAPSADDAPAGPRLPDSEARQGPRPPIEPRHSDHEARQEPRPPIEPRLPIEPRPPIEPRLPVPLQAGGAEPSRDGLDGEIEAAYFSLSGGAPNVRVRLADLRDVLSGAARADFDAVLLGMAASGRASLYRLDDPREIGPRDRDAVLRTPSGEERHIVYLGGRGS